MEPHMRDQTVDTHFLVVVVKINFEFPRDQERQPLPILVTRNTLRRKKHVVKIRIENGRATTLEMSELSL